MARLLDILIGLGILRLAVLMVAGTCLKGRFGVTWMDVHDRRSPRYAMARIPTVVFLILAVYMLPLLVLRDALCGPPR